MKTWQLGWPAVVSCTIAVACDGSVRSAAEYGGDTPTSDNSSASGNTTDAECIVVEGTGGGPGVELGLDASGPVTSPERRPPPLGGGGLLVSRDGKTVVAADADRDRLYLATLGEPATLTARTEIVVDEGDEPGRLVEDAARVVHTVLRGSGEVLSIDLETGEALARRAACDEPRGLAYDPGLDALHVACAEGRLVTLPLPEGPPIREWRLDDDLRDVVVQGDELLISRFRSAELLRVNSQGAVVERTKPSSLEASSASTCSAEARQFDSVAAWRLAPLSDGTALVLHQRSVSTPLELDTPTTYGGTCGGAVSSVVSAVDGVAVQQIAPALMGVTLATDIAVSPDGTQVAIAASSTDLALRSILVFDRQTMDAMTAPSESVANVEDTCVGSISSAEMNQPTAIAYTPTGQLVAFSRQPAKITLFAGAFPTYTEAELSVNDIDVTDTGHALFHADTGRGIACASCHPEAGDDGHVWSFEGFGPRRTQNLRGGILGTEPFHWEGDMPGFQELTDEVMVRRMGGPSLDSEHGAVLATWIDAQPAFTRTDFDPEAAERGRLLFESAETRCVTCHSGEAFTNNLSVDVGTGLTLQVPSLRGVSFRAPFLHDGCAQTLLDRFGSCGGGDEHGVTSQLGISDLDDLVAYMKTL